MSKLFVSSLGVFAPHRLGSLRPALTLIGFLLVTFAVRAQIPPTYSLNFGDEFNASSVNTAVWQYRTDGRYYSQQQAANVTESGGYLHIAVKQQTVGSYNYTGGGLISVSGFGYGYYEASVKVPVGAGWHSSFWAMAFNGTFNTTSADQELDFMEQDSSNPMGYHPNYHFWPSNYTWTGPLVPSPNDMRTTFNTIGCLYTPSGTTYYLNGVHVTEFDSSAYASNNANIWLTSIATTAPDNTQLPSEMLVDWVHYYAPSPSGSAPAQPVGLTATVGSTQVALSWTKPLGAVTYNVKRSSYSSGPYTTIAPGVTATNYTDTGLTVGTQYFYVVSAVNSIPLESASTPELSAITGITILDNAASTGVNVIGGWTATTFASGYYATNYLQDGNTAGGKSVTFAPTLPASGTYVVYARWTAGANRASNVPVDIYGASGTTTTVFVNEQVNNGTWFPLGAFSFNAGNGGYVKIRDDGANGFVVADAIMWVPTVPLVMVDSAPTGVTEVGTWTSSTSVPGYLGAYYLYDSAKSGSESVTFTPSIPVAGSYKVYALWTANSNRATNAPIDVYDASGTTHTVTVNQQINNVTWVLLGTFSFNAGSSSYVRIRDNGANGFVVANAIMWVPQ